LCGARANLESSLERSEGYERTVEGHHCSKKAYILRRVVKAMSLTEELLQNNAAYAESFEKGDLPLPPARAVAVVACMDARLDVHKILGLEEGDAHVIRNAEGVITGDEIRSLTISQRLLGTTEIILIHHTDCGMLTFSDDELKAQIHEEVGMKPHFSMESFSDLEEDVRQSVARIQASPFIPHKESERGFVYEVESGRLREVR
jgi:carbonic anhydrase